MEERRESDLLRGGHELVVERLECLAQGGESLAGNGDVWGEEGRNNAPSSSSHSWERMKVSLAEEEAGPFDQNSIVQ